ncbi:hypothetical protein CGC48_04155 [Capnocytophaga cynodegmi]|uniref:Thioredoxin domain-containing protein n=1 Tax=Capnocytophaga cynodegmi TaxID=28189 RepID=A0A250E827_9FLAO|nr:TlpA disulfide reductase family protein [Capnocytophaga cynodegmi]ATA67895.1 hypothetical protein CGC48_04155 [Capnocytophaga cynodegmi]
MKHLFLIKTMLLCFIFQCNIKAQSLNEIPENLHGFWKFQVEKKGDWNGIHVGKNYVEVLYNLVPIESIKQKDNRYELVLNAYGRFLDASITLIEQDKAKFVFGNKEFECTKYNADPDIVLLKPSNYKKVIKGILTRENNPRKQLSITKDTLHWNNADWKIHWLGKYLDKEYRALIEYNNSFKMVYITHSDNNIKFRTENNDEIYKIGEKIQSNYLYGTWCNPTTNEWVIGFFDKIVVYKNEAWTYQYSKKDENTYQITLSQEDKKETITCSFTGRCKNELTLLDGNQKIDLKYENRPQSYLTEDKHSFLDNNYKKEKVTIRGFLQKMPHKKPFKITVPNLITDEEDEFFADIDKNGCFSITFEVLNTSFILMDWGRTYLPDVVEPGEEYFLYIDYKNQDFRGNKEAIVWQMGKNARLHRELTSYFSFAKSDFFPHIDRSLPSDVFLSKSREALRNELKEIKQFVRLNKVISKRTLYFIEKFKLTVMARDMMQRKFDLERSKEGNFSADYMALADSVFQNMPKPLTLMRSNTFLNDYTAYYNEKVFLKPDFIGNLEVMKYFDKHKMVNLSEKEYTATHKLEEMAQKTFELRQQKADSTTFANHFALFKPYIDDFNAFAFTKSYEKLFTEQFPKIKDEVVYIPMLKRELSTLDSLKVSPEVKEIMYAGRAYNIYEGESRSLTQKEWEFFASNIKSSEILSILEDEQSKYNAVQGQDVKYSESLKRTEHLKDAKNADELFKKLTEPYLGKVIYIDFWGTWCAPCREQMKYIGKVKEELKGKDVVFMYFANRSPEDSWKNILKQYNLTGESVVHYNLPDEQQSMLERRLGVKSFPTYMIIDKQGNIVSTKPPMPIQQEVLVQELIKWIEK